MGVTEYWRFDPTGECFTPRLIGETLVGGQYQRLPLESDETGMIWSRSELLGLDICVLPGLELRLYDPAGGQWLLTPEETPTGGGRRRRRGGSPMRRGRRRRRRCGRRRKRGGRRKRRCGRRMRRTKGCGTGAKAGGGPVIRRKRVYHNHRLGPGIGRRGRRNVFAPATSPGPGAGKGERDGHSRRPSHHWPSPSAAPG